MTINDRPGTNKVLKLKEMEFNYFHSKYFYNIITAAYNDFSSVVSLLPSNYHTKFTSYPWKKNH